MLLKDRTIEDSSSSSSSCDERGHSRKNKSDGTGTGAFGIVPLDHEGTLGIGRGSG